MIGRIYKIVNDIDNSFYIGSTELNLNKRYRFHKNDCNSGSVKRVHQKMRDVGIEHCRIELIELPLSKMSARPTILSNISENGLN